ncbi:hypothetical protein GOODEAATRI_000153 [Goodea atripinnis]|uniref:Secreted protein n=1 Tax=Goodea atripinnis TaxID=208336 RepID=A0ABV0PA20_9TELE
MLAPPHHCIQFLFTICLVSQLFWNPVCTFTCPSTFWPSAMAMRWFRHLIRITSGCLPLEVFWREDPELTVYPFYSVSDLGTPQNKPEIVAGETVVWVFLLDPYSPNLTLDKRKMNECNPL